MSTVGAARASELQVASRWRDAARWAVLAAGDFFALAAAVMAGYLVWALPVHGMSVSMYLELFPFLALFLVAYAQAGLYPGFGLGPVELLRRTSLTTLLVAVVAASLTFALKLPHVYSRMSLGIALVGGLVAVPTLRVLVFRGAAGWDWWPEPVVLVGGPDEVGGLAEHLTDRPLLGYRAVGALIADGQESGTEADEAAGAMLAGLPVLGRVSADGTVPADARPVRTALVAGSGPAEVELAHRLQKAFRELLLVQTEGRLPVESVEVRNLGGLLGIRYSNNLLRARNRWLKRAFDLGVGTLLFLAAAPAIGVSALAVRLTTGGPAFYRDERAGHRGEPCSVPKIRTMRPNAREALERHLDEDPALREEWETHFKLEDDPRLIPGLGRFLRRWSLDELPQLWSVVTGEMSLVGPRPLPEYHAARYSDVARALREEVRPGVTGLWQVSDRSEATIEEQEAADVYYVRNWSLWLDLYLLARTVRAVLTGRGAY